MVGKVIGTSIEEDKKLPKQKKLEKLTNNEYLRKLECFDENLDLFTCPSDLSNYCENFCPDVINIAGFVTLNSPTRSSLQVTTIIILI